MWHTVSTPPDRSWHWHDLQAPSVQLWFTWSTNKTQPGDTSLIYSKENLKTQWGFKVFPYTISVWFNPCNCCLNSLKIKLKILMYFANIFFHSVADKLSTPPKKYTAIAPHSNIKCMLNWFPHTQYKVYLPWREGKSHLSICTSRVVGLDVEALEWLKLEYNVQQTALNNLLEWETTHYMVICKGSNSLSTVTKGDNSQYMYLEWKTNLLGK